MPVYSNHLKGSLYCAMGVLSFGPDSLLLRKVAMVPNWTVMFYRYLLLGCAMLTYVIVTERSQTGVKFKALGGFGFLAGVIWGAQNVLITAGFQLTSAANVLVILAANPLFAAVLSWLVLREKMKRRTALAAIVCLAVIVAIVWNELGSSGGEAGQRLIGVLSAVGASVTTAIYFVVLRLSSIRNAGVQVDMLPSIALSGFVALLISLAVDSSLAEVSSTHFIFIALQGAVCLPLGSIFLTLGPSLLSAPEVSLFTLLETVVGPLLVWLGGYEQPSLVALCGGCALLVALTAHSVVALQEEKRNHLEAVADAQILNSQDHSIPQVSWYAL